MGFPDKPGRVKYLSVWTLVLYVLPPEKAKRSNMFFSGYTRKGAIFCSRKGQEDKCDLFQKARKSIETPKDQEDQCAPVPERPEKAMCAVLERPGREL